MKKIHHISIWLLGLFYGIGGVFFQNETYALSNKTTPVKLSIYNSYSGHISFSPSQNIINVGGSLWTNDNSLSIIVSATTGSSFTISGNIITPIIGNGIGVYHIAESLELSIGDGIKTLHTLFMKDTEPYTENTSITLDTTAPTQSNIISPDNNNIVTGNIALSRSESSDNGVGLSHYKVHFSVDPGFLSETVIVSTGNILQIAENNIPVGIIYRYVESIDFLGNRSTSISKLFHHTLSITPEIPIPDTTSNGGGGGILQPPIYPVNNTGDSIDNTGTNTIITGTIDNNITGNIVEEIIPIIEFTGNVHNVGGDNDDTNISIIDTKNSILSNDKKNSTNKLSREKYYQESIYQGENMCSIVSNNNICTIVYNEIFNTKNIIDSIIIQYNELLPVITNGNTILTIDDSEKKMCVIVNTQDNLRILYNSGKQSILSTLPILQTTTPIFTGFYYIIQSINYGLQLIYNFIK